MTIPRVLVAEDDDEMRRIVAEALRKDGYEVTEVADGGRLLVQIGTAYLRPGAHRAFDLLVTDVRMPVCTGLQIVKGLRDAAWDTPVILMTAFGDDDTRRHAELLGARLLDKPFDVSDLRAAVRALIGTPDAALPDRGAS